MPSGRYSIDSTVPTWTPRILTLASGGFITSPARLEITVTGTVSVNLPANSPIDSARIAITTTTSPSPPARSSVVLVQLVSPPSLTG